jgi:aspartyl-tRNA synthetase
VFYKFAGLARNKVADELNLADKDQFKFCWIVDFPMYEWSEEEKKIDFSHNPFSMPNFDHEAFLKLDVNDRATIEKITAFQYDIVCNGVELSSGAIRNHKPEIMIKAFELAGYPQSVVEEKFGGMLNAFRFGAPPHGGSAPGVDRIVMLLAGVENIREVIVFPFNQQAQDLDDERAGRSDAEAAERAAHPHRGSQHPKRRRVVTLNRNAVDQAMRMRPLAASMAPRTRQATESVRSP